MIYENNNMLKQKQFTTEEVKGILSLKFSIPREAQLMYNVYKCEKHLLNIIFDSKGVIKLNRFSVLFK